MHTGSSYAPALLCVPQPNLATPQMLRMFRGGSPFLLRVLAAVPSLRTPWSVWVEKEAVLNRAINGVFLLGGVSRGRIQRILSAGKIYPQLESYRTSSVSLMIAISCARLWVTHSVTFSGPTFLTKITPGSLSHGITTQTERTFSAKYSKGSGRLICVYAMNGFLKSANLRVSAELENRGADTVPYDARSELKLV